MVFKRLFTLFMTLFTIYGYLQPAYKVTTTMMEFLERPYTFRHLTKALKETKLDIQFRKRDLIGSQFTLFAPIDMAFDNFGRMGLMRSKDPFNPDPKKQEIYQQFLRYHFVKGKIGRGQLRRLRRTLKTVSGSRLNPNDIKEIVYSVQLKNGVVHVIKNVLIDPKIRKFLYPKK